MICIDLCMMCVCRDIISALSGGNPARGMQPGFAGHTTLDNKAIYMGVPFRLVDTNPTKRQAFPQLATTFDGRPSESDAGEVLDAPVKCVMCRAATTVGGSTGRHGGSNRGLLVRTC